MIEEEISKIILVNTEADSFDFKMLSKSKEDVNVKSHNSIKGYEFKRVNFVDVFDYIINDYKLYDKLLSSMKKKIYNDTDFSKIIPDYNNLVRDMFKGQKLSNIYDLNSLAYTVSFPDITKCDDSKSYPISLFKMLSLISSTSPILNLNNIIENENCRACLHLIYLVYINLCIDNGYSHISIFEYLNFIGFILDINWLSKCGSYRSTLEYMFPVCTEDNICMKGTRYYYDLPRSMMSSYEHMSADQFINDNNIESTLKLLDPNWSTNIGSRVPLCINFFKY